MKSIRWSAEYSVGHPLLDSQHKKLLSLCNEALACMNEQSRESEEHFNTLLAEVMKYAKEHFRTEEALLAFVGYPKLQEQREEHYSYMEHFSELALRATAGIFDRQGICELLLNWWSKHILESDMQYKHLVETHPNASNSHFMQSTLPIRK